MMPQNFPLTIEWILKNQPAFERLAIRVELKAELDEIYDLTKQSMTISRTLIDICNNHPLKHLEVTQEIDPIAFEVILSNCHQLGIVKCIVYDIYGLQSLTKTIPWVTRFRSHPFFRLTIEVDHRRGDLSFIDEYLHIDSLPAVKHIKLVLPHDLWWQRFESTNFETLKRRLAHHSSQIFANCLSLRSYEIACDYNQIAPIFRTTRCPRSNELSHRMLWGDEYLA